MIGVLQESVNVPTSDRPPLGAALVRLVARAEAIGLIGPGAGRVGDGRFREVLAALEKASIGIASVQNETVESDPARAVEILTRELEECPVPGSTWSHLSELLDLDALARLVGVSDVSARRYMKGTRPTPDDVAFRLHVVALIVADLAGSYNAYGIRRWFSRPRLALDHQAPSEILQGHWDPDTEEVRKVRALASALTGPLAT